MTAFKSYRIAYEYTQTNPATPDKVFPLRYSRRVSAKG